ncbi:protein DEHYDRATION-INDUCED 19-like isoform X2 [Nymphaea colorata]|uniref:protein DEHYDRATION-INDUCED 19-like isoform X2 n=1 Tax=Nymphaea colorata TaxID=210225 RepID=UPI00129E7DB9|nr:protein DEHYDRATION-INDUCED 19-like isoform X2 [Nymphaea colorata]
MEAADLWASRFAAAKRQYSLHHNSHPGGDRRSLMDDLESEEELRPDFPCPYCYEDYDIASLCSHLEDEHPSVDSRAAVCPICLVKVPRDLLNHIMLQHRRQRLRKVALSSSQASSLLGYDLREAHLSVLLGGGGGGGGGGGYRLSGINSSGTSVLVNDSLLSTLVLNFASPEPEEASKAFASSVDDFLKKSAPSSQSWKSRFDSCTSSEEREVKFRQATVRASFVQDLFLSTLFE